VRDESLGIPFISSLAIHGLVILLGSFLVHQSNLHRREFLPINLVDLPRPEISPPLKKIEAPEAKNAPSPPPPKAEKPKPPPAIEKTPIVKPDSPAPLPPPLGKEEPTKVVEMKPAPSAKAETAPSFVSGARVEGGGSEAGAGNLFGKGDIGVVPPEQELPAEAAARPHPDWVAARVRRGCRRSPCSAPTAKPNRFRPCAPTIRRWRCAPASKAM
jgi:outer membrane biosynthesis protein TonB